MSKGKEIEGLNCDGSAAEGIRLLLSARLEEMCGLRDGALDWSDIEGVHDMRVASRRLRSALRDFMPFLKRRKLRHAGDAIKRIADALGAVRDKDVAIAALEKLALNSPPEVAAGIQEFADERRVRLADDRTSLVDALADEHLVRLRDEFYSSLDSAIGSSRQVKSKTVDDPQERSFRAAGRMIVVARIAELKVFSTSLYRPLTTRPLHRMRIASKRLRYAIELFAQCWDTQLDTFAKEIAAMQTSLGELHDCDVWIAELGGLLEKQGERNVASAPTKTVDDLRLRRHAHVWLLGYFTKRRTNHYRDALARWHDWETTQLFSRLETCIQNSPG